MANKNYNNNPQKGSKSTLDRIREKAKGLREAVKSNQAKLKISYEKNHQQPEMSDAEMEDLLVTRSKAMMTIYRSSLLWGSPEQEAQAAVHPTEVLPEDLENPSKKKRSFDEILISRAERLIETVREYKANHNKEDLMSGMFKTLYAELTNNMGRPNPDVAKIKKVLDDINVTVRDEIKKELEKSDFGLERGEYVQVHDDYYRIARLDFDSTIEPVSDRFLSEEYLQAKNAKSEKKYSPDDYRGLHERSETWKRCREFQNFRNMQPKLFKALAEANIPPEVADKMKIRDIEDVMFNYLQKNDRRSDDKKAARYSLFGQDDAKRQFVKSVVDTDEKAAAFKNMMIEQGAAAEYATAMVEKMRLYGVINPGEVRNEKGEVIPPPKFKLSIHHKHAIQDMGSLNPKSKINDLSNFVLVLDKPYHQPICHGMDLPSYRKNKEGKSYIERIKFPKGLVVMFGFSKKKQMRISENEQAPERKYSKSERPNNRYNQNNKGRRF